MPDSYYATIIQQLQVLNDSLGNDKIEKVLNMDIAQNEKDELVDMIIKNKQFAEEASASFEAMNPSIKTDYKKFKDKILDMIENDVEERRELEELNKPHATPRAENPPNNSSSQLPGAGQQPPQHIASGFVQKQGSGLNNNPSNKGQDDMFSFNKPGFPQQPHDEIEEMNRLTNKRSQEEEAAKKAQAEAAEKLALEIEAERKRKVHEEEAKKQEQERLRQEQEHLRQEEERRRLEEERRRHEEEQRRHEEELQAAKKKKQEDEERQAAERKRLEEERIAQEKKKREEELAAQERKRREEEQAALEKKRQEEEDEKKRKSMESDAMNYKNPFMRPQNVSKPIRGGADFLDYSNEFGGEKFEVPLEKVDREGKGEKPVLKSEGEKGIVPSFVPFSKPSVGSVGQRGSSQQSLQLLGEDKAKVPIEKAPFEVADIRVPEENSFDRNPLGKQGMVDKKRLDILENSDEGNKMPAVGGGPFKPKFISSTAIVQPGLGKPDDSDFKKFYEGKIQERYGVIEEHPESHEDSNRPARSGHLNPGDSKHKSDHTIFSNPQNVPAGQLKPEKVKDAGKTLSFARPPPPNADSEDYLMGYKTANFKMPNPVLASMIPQDFGYKLPSSLDQPNVYPHQSLLNNPIFIQDAAKGRASPRHNEQIEAIVETRLKAFESKYNNLQGEVARLQKELEESKKNNTQNNFSPVGGPLSPFFPRADQPLPRISSNQSFAPNPTLPGRQDFPGAGLAIGGFPNNETDLQGKDSNYPQPAVEPKPQSRPAIFFDEADHVRPQQPQPIPAKVHAVSKDFQPAPTTIRVLPSESEQKLRQENTQLKKEVGFLRLIADQSQSSSNKGYQSLIERDTLGPPQDEDALKRMWQYAHGVDGVLFNEYIDQTGVLDENEHVTVEATVANTVLLKPQERQYFLKCSLTFTNKSKELLQAFLPAITDQGNFFKILVKPLFAETDLLPASKITYTLLISPRSTRVVSLPILTYKYLSNRITMPCTMNRFMPTNSQPNAGAAIKSKGLRAYKQAQIVNGNFKSVDYLLKCFKFLQPLGGTAFGGATSYTGAGLDFYIQIAYEGNGTRLEIQIYGDPALEQEALDCANEIVKMVSSAH